MFGWLKSLVDKSSEPRLVVEGCRLDTSIKLSHPITTPGGSRVTLISFCVNVHYSMDNQGNPVIHRVQLWHPDGSVSDVLARCNVFATHKGEAWYASSFQPESALMLAVEAELALKDSWLRRMMMGRWRAENRGELAQSIAESLNNRSEPEPISKLIATAGRGKEISFTYTKTDGIYRTRQVSVVGVSGNLLRARDLEDGEFKSFRIDRISNARAL